MRNLIFAFVLLVASCAANPALALECVTVEADTVAQGIAAVKGGQLKGAVLEGKAAAAFVKEIGLVTDVVAAFLVEWEGKDMLVIVATVNGQTAACYGEAKPAAVKIFRKYSGPAV